MSQAVNTFVRRPVLRAVATFPESTQRALRGTLGSDACPGREPLRRFKGAPCAALARGGFANHAPIDAVGRILTANRTVSGIAYNIGYQFTGGGVGVGGKGGAGLCQITMITPICN